MSRYNIIVGRTKRLARYAFVTIEGASICTLHLPGEPRQKFSLLCCDLLLFLRVKS